MAGKLFCLVFAAASPFIEKREGVAEIKLKYGDGPPGIKIHKHKYKFQHKRWMEMFSSE